jgi:protein-disulfide isomerase/uncharacterized membrane protein
MIRQIPKSYLYLAVRLLSLVALVFASMLAVDYYFVANTFCAAGADCQVVAQSEFGQKYGIFLPALGLVAYSFFFLMSFFFTKTRRKMFGKSLATFWAPLAIICCALGATLFFIVQKFEIHAFCWMCVGIDTAALIMVIPAILLFLNKTEETNAENDTKDKLGFWTGCISDLKASCTQKISFLHPVLWLTVYFLCAAGPIYLGTRPDPEPEKPAALTGDLSAVPEYIKSFYVPGKINVVEISSFDCPHCRQLHPELSKVLAEYGDSVNFTRLTIPLGKQKEACVAYFCAEKQKKEIAFADCMFEEPTKDAAKLLEHARHCSIDETAFKQCLTDPASSKAVDDILNNIRNAGFQGAPTIWIENTEIIGYNTQKGMEPYRQALGEKPTPKDESKINPRELANHITLVCLILAGLCLITGAPLTLSRMRKK